MAVELDLDGHVFSRSRKGSSNLITLDGKEYKAFGNNMPKEVEAFLNVCELNFQSQFDGFFWFNAKPPVIAQELNQIVSLSEIDAATQNVANEVRKRQREVRDCEALLEEKKYIVAKFAWVEDAHKDGEVLRKLLKKLKKLKKEKEELLSIKKTILKYELILENGSKVLDKYPTKELEDLDDLKKRRLVLKELRDDLKEEKQWVKKIKSQLKAPVCPKCKRPLEK